MPMLAVVNAQTLVFGAKKDCTEDVAGRGIGGGNRHGRGRGGRCRSSTKRMRPNVPQTAKNMEMEDRVDWVREVLGARRP